jgi:glutamyl-tRNA reductase
MRTDGVIDAALRGAVAGCLYIDDTVADLRELGEAHEHGPQQRRPAADGVLRLMTCHRDELYFAPGCHQLTHPWGPRAVRVDGDIEPRIRLTEIAAGTRSLIPGEQFIFDQVAGAVRSLPDDAVLRSVGEEALRVARRVRDDYGLRSEMDYPEAAHVLSDQAGGGGTLVVIGAGALARAVAAHPLADTYDRVLMVTRSPKRARRRLPADTRVQCHRVQTAVELLDRTERWVAMVATVGMTPAYQEAITSLLGRHGGRSVVDLSSTPLTAPASGGVQMVSMYEDRFLTLVREANARVAARVPAAQAAIAEYYRAEF